MGGTNSNTTNYKINSVNLKKINNNFVIKELIEEKQALPIIDDINKSSKNNKIKITSSYLNDNIVTVLSKIKLENDSDNNSLDYDVNFENKSTINLEIESLNKNNFRSLKNCKSGYNNLNLENNSNLICYLLNQKVNGFAVYKNETKNKILMGQFINNKIKGFCIYFDNKFKIKYRGEWDKNTPNGFGIESWGDDSNYTGDIKNGIKEGFGTYNFPDESYYQGYFIANKYDGYGIYRSADGREYVGEFKNGFMEGYGEFKWPDGNAYLGYYIKDLKEGFGVYFIKKSKNFFMGFWKNGKQHLLGKLINQHNIMRYSLWQDGIKIKDFNTEEEVILAENNINYNEYIKQFNKYKKLFNFTFKELKEFFNLTII